MIRTNAWDEVGDRVFRRRYEAYYRFNVGVVLGADGVMVIDTRSSHVQARELIADLRLLTDLPVRWVVNTHYHWDHTWGNALFRGTPILGHVECRNEMLRQDAKAVEEVAESAPGLREELMDLEILPPDQVFTEAATIDLGDRTVTLQHLGRAHTNSDIVVTISGDSTVFAGDLFEEAGPPWYGDAFPLAWPLAVQRLLLLADGVVIPGHGEPVERGYLEGYLKALEQVAALAAEYTAGRVSRSDATHLGPYPAETMDIALARASVSL